MSGIDYLRAKYPSVRWVWDSRRGEYAGSDGSAVRRVGALAPRYDGDDDNFVTEHWRYFEDTRPPERIWFA